jgi:hypothetical protein
MSRTAARPANRREILKIESRSANNPLYLGLEIPLHACDACRNMGYKILEESQLKGEFRYIQFVNRRDKEYVRYGF